MGVSGGKGFPLRWLSVVTSLPAGVRSASRLCRDVLGGVDSAHLKTNEDAFGVCFLFVLSVLCIKHRALLNAPRFDMAPSSVMGCLAQGMYLWPILECLKCMVLQAAAEVEAGNFVTCTKTPVSEPGFLSSFCTIVYAHLCYYRELFQTCRATIAPRHTGAALFLSSPKKPHNLIFALKVDLESLRVDCWTLLKLE